MSTNYAERFEASLPALEQAINQMPGDVSSNVPDLDKNELLRFCRSFGPLLQRVDTAKGIDRSALVYGASNVPEQVLSSISTATGQAPNGIDYFVQNHLTTLTDLRNRLEIAVGTAAGEGTNPGAIKRKLQALERLFDAASEELSAFEVERGRLDEQVTALASSIAQLEAQKVELDQLATQMGDLRDKARDVVEQGSSTDPSIMVLYDQIRKVGSKVDERLAKVNEALTQANEAATTAAKAKQSTLDIQAEARAALANAQQALRGSTQAGLAESFIAERDSKLTGLYVYGAALVIAIIGAAIFAVREVLPAVSEFTKAIATGENDIGALGISLSIRTVLLAPFVFLAWFAAVQYRRIDLLRIDYAAKAAVAKAYVGYKDEVKGDPKLMSALKAYLIQRFGEHPVRLVTDASDDIPLQIFGIDQPEATAPNPRRRKQSNTEPGAG